MDNKINNDVTLMEKRNLIVKLHLFIPSRKKVWTVVGNNEYWLDINLNYCSCKYYYYKSLMNTKKCRHLEKLSSAIKDNTYEQTVFNDQEYNMFVIDLLKDILNTNF